tara:strand:- start:4308 stop:4556 length:249 start_codon:yes stop_codon:yes gene_type:complete
MEQMDFVATGSRAKPTIRRRSEGVAPAAVAKRASNGPREGHRRLTADIPTDLHKRLKMQALMEDRTVTDILLDATRSYLSQK